MDNKNVRITDISRENLVRLEELIRMAREINSIINMRAEAIPCNEVVKDIVEEYSLRKDIEQQNCFLKTLAEELLTILEAL